MRAFAFMRRAGALIACGLFACGGEISSIGEPGPTPTAPAEGSQPPRPSPETDIPPGPSRDGSIYVYVVEHVTAEGKHEFIVASDAWFGAREEPAGTAISGCTIDDRFPPTSGASTGEPTSDNAGRIDIDVMLGEEKTDIRLPFDTETSTYEYFSGSAEGPASGTIHVRAHGGTVPAFTVDLPAQTPLLLVSPTPGATIGARDLKVSWTSDPNADFAIVVVDGVDKEVRCSVPTGNEITIPESMMASLLAAPNSEGAQLAVYTAKAARVDVGDHRVRVNHGASFFVGLLKE